MPFWLLQTLVILWKKHLKGIQDSTANWGLQTRHITFILHDQCLSDDKHFKIDQSTPLASPHFLNKNLCQTLFLPSDFSISRACVLLLPPTLGDLPWCRKWELTFVLWTIGRGGGVRTAEQASAKRTVWTGITGHSWVVLNPLCHCSTHLCWAQSNGPAETTHTTKTLNSH